MDPSHFPPAVRAVLSALNAAGHQAYAVGGAVRDCLLGRTPDDWDVCTSALPEQTMALFAPTAEPTGLKHGTVTVTSHGRSIEITTFRREGRYTDHRRPDHVDFVRDVTEDLSRRDFTINAMAMGADGVLVDPFGGQADLAAGLIRCVGSPRQRFSEDALRMWRALRFSARLGFALTPDTRDAIVSCAPLAADLAPERVLTELEKLLLHPCAEALALALDSGLFAQLSPRLFPPNSSQNAQKSPASLPAFSRLLEPLEQLPAQPLPRLTGLCFLLSCHFSADIPQFLAALRASSRQQKWGVNVCERLSFPPPSDTFSVKMLLYREGVDFCRLLWCVSTLLPSPWPPLLEPVIASGECFDLAHLALRGQDLFSLGLRGPAVGQALERSLFHVMAHPQDNHRDKLLSLINSGSTP